MEALKILDRRLASGEISLADYDRIRRVLIESNESEAERLPSMASENSAHLDSAPAAPLLMAEPPTTVRPKERRATSEGAAHAPELVPPSTSPRQPPPLPPSFSAAARTGGSAEPSTPERRGWGYWIGGGGGVLAIVALALVKGIAKYEIVHHNQQSRNAPKETLVSIGSVSLEGATIVAEVENTANRKDDLLLWVEDAGRKDLCPMISDFDAHRKYTVRISCPGVSEKFQIFVEHAQESNPLYAKAQRF